MPISALFFDLDGTLLDTNTMHARAWQRAFDSRGYRVPAERILLEIGKGGDRVVPTLMGEEAEARHGEALRDTQSDAYQQIIADEKVRVLPGAEALLRAASNDASLQTALVTAASEEDLENMLGEAGLDVPSLVDVVVTDDDADESKPAPASVLAAVEKLGVAAGECVLVGDTPYDALAARRAGVVGLGVLTGAHSARALHRAGMRASYDDAAALHEQLPEALHRAAPGRKALNESHLKALMQEALDEAWIGLSEGEVPIGSVVANGAGRVVGRGHNQARARGYRTAHAEMLALADAGHDASAEGTVLVSTVEPCAMCLGAAMETGLDTVVYAMRAEANGGSERVEPPADGFFPRLIGGVRTTGSRTLLRRWAHRHPEDDFVHGLLD